jgi:hypothetical protein
MPGPDDEELLNRRLALDRARVHAGDLACDLARGLALAHLLARILARGLAFDRALALVRDLDLGRALGLVSCLDRAVVRTAEVVRRLDVSDSTPERRRRRFGGFSRR